MPALVLAWIATSGFAGAGLAGVENTRAMPVVERLAPALAADAKFADKIPPVATPPLVSRTLDFPPPSDLSLASVSTTEAVLPAAAPALAAREPEPIVTASLTDPSEKLRPETAPEPTANTTNTNAVNPVVASLETGNVRDRKSTRLNSSHW